MCHDLEKKAGTKYISREGAIVLKDEYIYIPIKDAAFFIFVVRSLRWKNV
jgi:hypothetical protein